jgi:DNA-binding GntR family transcriptional regulator
MSSFIGPLVQESTPSIIAEKLRQAIAHGELKPGAQLGEAELARKLGVSRGPLREGMQRLTQEGLLVSIRNRGLFVIEVTTGPQARSCWTSSTRWPKRRLQPMSASSTSPSMSGC